MYSVLSDDDKLILPTSKTEIIRPWFLPSRSMLAEQHKLLNHTYYLVRQGDTFGERLKCTRCQRRHNYITLMCIERPFTGLVGGLYAYYHLVKDNGLLPFMTEGERARYASISRSFNDMPDLGKLHPQLAKKFASDLGPSDMRLGALSMGVLEGIAEIHAHRLVDKINTQGIRPKLVLEEPNPYEQVRRERNGL